MTGVLITTDSTATLRHDPPASPTCAVVAHVAAEPATSQEAIGLRAPLANIAGTK